MDRLADRPYWVLSFREDGTLASPDAAAFSREVADSGVRDLFVLSHGWNTGERAADDLYADLLPRVAAAAEQAPGLGPAGLVGIHWPALWFPERPGAPRADSGGGDAQTSGSAAAVLDSGDATLSGGEIAATLGASFGDERRAVVEQLGRLIDDGSAAAAGGTEPDAAQRARLAEFSTLLRQLVPQADDVATEDRGERRALFSQDPEKDYAFLAEQFGHGAVPGAAQGVGDAFRSVWNGAKDALRITSYYVMKKRAGTIGRVGLGPLLADLHGLDASRQVRVHLVGHSFGGRLVAFALAGIPSPAVSPVASLVLVQAAFSHYAFSSATDNPFEAEGALRTVADRVRGPLVATFSSHDRAVGTWYPKASALARQDNQANPAVSRWGGLGGGGFQAVTPLASSRLRPVGEGYGFAPQHFYGIDGASVIKDVAQSAFAGAHSDIRHPEVAWLIASAAATGAAATT